MNLTLKRGQIVSTKVGLEVNVDIVDLDLGAKNLPDHYICSYKDVASY